MCKIIILNESKLLSLYWFCYTIQSLKTNDCVLTALVYFAYMLMRGASLKQKMPCIMHISIFGAFSAEKSVHYYIRHTQNNNSSKVLSAMQLLH